MKNETLKNIIKESITDYLSELNTTDKEETSEEPLKEYPSTSTPGMRFEDKVTKGDGYLYLVKEAMNESTEKNLVEKMLLTDLIGEGYTGAYLNEAAAEKAAKGAIKAKEVLMKDNVKKMQEMMKNWKKPLFERKLKPLLPEDLEQTHSSMVMPKLEDIKNHGKEIHKLMKDTAENIKPDKKSITWLAYVDYVNGLIVEGITEGINASLAFLADQISISFNKLHTLPPMFDIKVDLRDRDVVFDPSINFNKHFCEKRIITARTPIL
jgi:hypothetical protein